MSSWYSDAFNSHKVQLIFTAVVSGTVVASAIIGLQAAKRQYKVHDLKESIPKVDEKHDVGRINNIGGDSVLNSTTRQFSNNSTNGPFPAQSLRRQIPYDPSLITEQLSRNASFLGADGFSKLRSSFVIVVGCGGVGSHAVAALARAGVGRIRIIDFDQVTLSSLNRHSVATLEDVGSPKVTCLKKHIQSIAPFIEIEAINRLFKLEDADELLKSWTAPSSTSSNSVVQSPSYVIDAIDNLTTKIQLLAYTSKHKIPVISSMGAGCKSDPTRLLIGDISSSTEDPLSRSTRRGLRIEGISSGVACVYSTEKPGRGKASLLPLPESDFQKSKETDTSKNVNDFSILPDFRVRILPVLGTMPAIFGLVVANHVILSLGDHVREEGYVAGNKLAEKACDSVVAYLQSCEEKLAKKYKLVTNGVKVPFDSADVGYLIEEVYRNKSVVSGLTTRLVLVRWTIPLQGIESMVDKSIDGQKCSSLKFNEVVCMTREEANRHEKRILHGGEKVEDVYSKETLDLVQKRWSEEEWYRQFR